MGPQPMVLLAKFHDAPSVVKMVRRRNLDPVDRRPVKGARGPANSAGGHGVEMPAPSDATANAEIGGPKGLGPCDSANDETTSTDFGRRGGGSHNRCCSGQSTVRRRSRGGLRDPNTSRANRGSDVSYAGSHHSPVDPSACRVARVHPAAVARPNGLRVTAAGSISDSGVAPGPSTHGDGRCADTDSRTYSKSHANTYALAHSARRPRPVEGDAHQQTRR